jgi:hypothetical protein
MRDPDGASSARSASLPPRAAIAPRPGMAPEDTVTSILHAIGEAVGDVGDGQRPSRWDVGFAFGFVAGVAAVTAVVMAMFSF